MLKLLNLLWFFMYFKNYIEQFGQLKFYQKSSHVFKQGDNDSHMYFIKTGLIKAYYLTIDGKEFIKSFILPGNIIGNLSSIKTELPCTFSLQCLEESELYRLNYQDIYNQCLSDQNMSKTMIDILLQLVQKKEKREFEFLCLSAEERYDLLKLNKPELIDKLTQNDIAKYLGVTAVGLSRIKNRQLRN